MKAKKRTKPMTNLFHNNKFVLVFSLVFAFIIWLSVALTVSPEIERTITDIPITIDMENSTPARSSLEYFISKDEDLKVNVTITGKRYAIGALDKDNIKVIAVTSNVNSSGYHTLNLRMDTNVEFTSFDLSEDNITVFFDTRSETEFTIQSEIIADKVIPSDEYIQPKEIVSQSTILITGSTQEIEKIDKVVAQVKLEKVISKTETFDANIILKAKDGSGEINNDFLTLGSVDTENNIKVTIPVLKKKVLPVSVKFTNSPEYYSNNPLAIIATPNTANIATLESDIDKINFAYVGAIDFSKINNKVNEFIFTAENFADPNITAIENNVQYKVRVDASMMESKMFSMPASNVEFQNLSDQLIASAVKGIDNVKVIGSTTSLENLTPSGLYAEIDMKDIISEGTYAVPARIYAKSVSDCWVYGDYTVSVIVKK